MLEENVVSSAGARHRSNLHELIQHDPHGRPRPGAARHPLPATSRCTGPRPTTRPTTGCVSHFSSIAMPGGGAGRSLPLVEAR